MAHQREAPVAAETVIERETDPQHGVRLEQTCDPQRPRVDRLEAELTDQRYHLRFRRRVIAGADDRKLHVNFSSCPDQRVSRRNGTGSPTRTCAIDVARPGPYLPR